MCLIPLLFANVIMDVRAQCALSVVLTINTSSAFPFPTDLLPMCVTKLLTFYLMRSIFEWVWRISLFIFVLGGMFLCRSGKPHLTPRLSNTGGSDQMNTDFVASLCTASSISLCRDQGKWCFHLLRLQFCSAHHSRICHVSKSSSVGFKWRQARR